MFTHNLAPLRKILKMKPFAFVLIFSLLFVSTSTGFEATQKKDPELLQCFHLCKQQQAYSETEKSECRDMCKQYIKEKQRRAGGCETRVGAKEEGDENPYVFEEKHFRTVLKSEHGQVQVLPKFNHALLKGIENFRLSVLVANPRAFFSPGHSDAETLIFVSQGTSYTNMIILFNILCSSTCYSVEGEMYADL